MDKEAERRSKVKFILMAITGDAVLRGENVGIPFDLVVDEIEKIYNQPKDGATDETRLP